ncbi:MAG: hypothetical protein CVT49_03680 [candidate division Zixibacteria bacterium HGW-Zixibacteria-1]|nr:MAG: hypothetical protein CVT49_03680 [candidate division Zixibacteria bacterium HGW-Zixibacteria-1]
MRSGSLVFGIILILVGSLFLLNSVDMDIFDIFDFWPMVLILVGLVILFNRPRKQSLKEIAKMGGKENDTK